MTETFRKADLVDVSRACYVAELGARLSGPPSRELPYRGFHVFLAKGLTRYAARHPLRPLPMMRW